LRESQYFLFLFFKGGKISPNFDLKYIISSYIKVFPWKKKNPNSLDFEEKKFKSPDFCDKFQ